VAAVLPATQWMSDTTGVRLVLSGDWTTAQLDKVGWPRSIPSDIANRPVVVDFGKVSALDSNAALALQRWIDELRKSASTVELTTAPAFYHRIAEAYARSAEADLAQPKGRLTDSIAEIGHRAMDVANAALHLLSFQGQVVVRLIQTLARPNQLRLRSMIYHMQAAGVSALPIVGLLSFLLGVVTAYQGADQLARFGAQIFTVNVVGIGVLREMGALITAIVVAGRSASAFAAQIGTMKINEEIDAMRVIGLDPITVLVIPRVLALGIMFPFMVVFADALGILGGAIMATLSLDISFGQFLRQFQAEVPILHFWVGLSKAPLFAMAIAAIGCQQGLMVGQDAASVGVRTTAAVVQTIFFVIVIDAGMSIFVSILGV
jgi:phospholipid/cholesterol/gamma-HCH transport system permease protein